MIRTNSSERQCIPNDCQERFILFSSNGQRIWPGHEIDVAGLSRLTAGYEICRWAFRFHVVLVVTQGELELVADRPPRQVHPGEMVFMPASMKVTYRVRQSCQLSWLHLIPESEYWQDIDGMELFVRRTRHAAKIPVLMEYLYSENVVPNAGNSVNQHLLCQLLKQYLREDLLSVKHGQPLRPLLEQCFRMVSESPEHPWQVTELCRLAAMIRPAFFAAVHTHYGLAPMTLVRQIRLTSAASLLLTTDGTLDSIAERTGFDCGFSLSRAFRREYGCSPGRWRTLHRQSIPD